jgi:hypothetical protein
LVLSIQASGGQPTLPAKTVTVQVGSLDTLDDQGTVKVASGATLDVLGTLTVASGATLDDQGTVTVSTEAALNIDGNVTVSDGAHLDLFSRVTEGNSGNLDDQGAVTVVAPATFTFDVFGQVQVEGNATLDIQSFVTVEAGATLDDQGSVTVESLATLDVHGMITVQATGILDDRGLSPGGLTVESDGTLDVSGKGTVESNATLDVKGAVEVAPGASLVNQGTVTVEATGMFFDQGTMTVAAGGTLDISGTLTQGVGSSLNVFAFGTLTVEGGGAMTVEGDGFLLMSGSVSVVNGATLDIKGLAEIGAGGTLGGQGTVTVEPTGSLSDQDAITVAAGGALDIFGTLTEGVGGSLHVFGALTVETGGALIDYGTVAVERGASYSLLGTVTVEPGGVLTLPRASTGTSLAASISTPLAGVDPVILTATVASAAPVNATVSGTVDFFDTTAGADLGSAAVVNGVASLTAGPFVAGGHTITATYSGDNNFLSSSGTASLIALVPASLSGSVFADFNDDGQIDFGENGISGVSVHLTGTDDLGHAVDHTVQTDGDGAYVFRNLRPGSYALTETPPAGYLPGIDSVGTAGGSVAAPGQFAVPLGVGVNALNYNFGEQPPAGGGVHHGQTAGIGFWNNKNGQALIKALNGGTGHQLGEWLAATLPNVFGKNSANNLAGQSNAYIAALFQQDFVQKGVKLNAQVLATALSVYATNATLDPTQVAARYGFKVSGTGAGTATVNVGCCGAAFGVANNSMLTLMDLLVATDEQAVNGVLYNGDLLKRIEASLVYGFVNEAGGI